MQNPKRKTPRRPDAVQFFISTLISVTQTALPTVVIIEPSARRDERGFFLEAYHRANYIAAGIANEFVQDNHSRSTQGVLRGLHYQAAPNAQAKLVRCTVGSVLDVAVDIRAASPTLGKWVAVELSAGNMRQLMIPAGFAHGFLTLTEVAEIQYKVDAYYDPSAEGGLAWNDPDMGITWPNPQPILSARDQGQPSLQQYLKNPRFP